MPHSDEFLRDYYKDLRDSMQERRQLEQQLVQYLIIFYPVLISAFVSLYQTDIESKLFILVAAGGGLFVFLVSIAITYRIYFEHKAYANMGETAQKIWEYFELFKSDAYLVGQSILSDKLKHPKTGFGQGKGHRRTLLLIWLITIAVLAMLFALSWAKT